MNRKKLPLMMALVTLMGVLLLSANSLSAGIKDRMKARIPEIKALKEKGAIGENNKGYLEAIGKNGAKSGVVAAENKDRKKVYEAIAKKQGVSAAAVGKRRAMQIAEKANPGEWLQGKNGKWYQKK